MAADVEMRPRAPATSRSTRRAWHLARKVLRRVFWVVVRVLPPRPHAIVHGWPTLEGNIVELLPALTRRYRHRVVWLVDDDPTAARGCIAKRELSGIEVIPKKSLKAVWLALTAEVTFFTHGLFTLVSPPSDRLVVNLWHGDGPKATTHAEDLDSTVAVSGARMWQAYKADIFRLRLEDVACTGNPRTAAMRRGMSAEQWDRLALDPSHSLVIWLPTFRQGRNAAGRLWEDGAPLSERSDLRRLREAVERSGVSLVVKPHPMDRDDYSAVGIRVITDADLREADVALYELLGASSAMISDTSSVWVDYLPLDRPIGFFLQDADTLAARRGFNVPDLLSVLPGTVLGGVDDIRQFLEAVARDPLESRLMHEERRARIGATPLGDAPTRLLDWLDEYQTARGRRPLFDGGTTSA